MPLLVIFLEIGLYNRDLTESLVSKIAHSRPNDAVFSMVGNFGTTFGPLNYFPNNVLHIILNRTNRLEIWKASNFQLQKYF